jgi:cell division protein ZapB
MPHGRALLLPGAASMACGDVGTYSSTALRHGLLTVLRAWLYSRAMSSERARLPFELELERLERRVEELVGICAQLKEENRSLRQRQEALITERAGLLQKNEQVRARVEAMIGRLKSLEQGT